MGKVGHVSHYKPNYLISSQPCSIHVVATSVLENTACILVRNRSIEQLTFLLEMGSKII